MTDVTKDFNAAEALRAAVKANDVTRAEELLKAGAVPDSHMLALALNDDFAIQQHKGSVGADDLLMAKLLLRHGADINGNNHEAVIAAFAKPSLLGIFLASATPGCDLRGALKHLKTLPQYAGPEYDRGRAILKSFVRRFDSLGHRINRSLKAVKDRFGGGPSA